MVEWQETGAAFEARHWGRDLKNYLCRKKQTLIEVELLLKVYTLLTAIWECSGGKNQPEDHVRYARNDLMGMVREDLGYDMARHVDFNCTYV